MSMALGRSVKQAVVFLEQIYKDIYSFVQSMDGSLSERGWKSVEQNRISEDLGNGLTAKHWVMHRLYRLYVPEKKGHPVHALAVMVHLTPEGYDEAMVLVTAVRFPKEGQRTPEDILSTWISSEDVFRSLSSSTEPRSVDEKLRAEGFFHGAEAAWAFVIPLCELTDTGALRQRLIEPGLALFER